MRHPTKGNSYQPAVQRALAYLRSRVADNTWLCTGFLPSLAALASAAMVSRITMWKAVGVLRTEGILSVVARGRISLAGQEEAAPIARPPQWQAVRNLLVNDILDNRFAQSAISLKELRSRYNISDRALRRIIPELLVSGLLKHAGKKLVTPASTKRWFQSTLVVASTSFRHVWKGRMDYHVAEERMKGVIDVLEKECAVSGLSLMFIDFEYGDPRRSFKAIRSLQGNDAVVGSLVNLWLPGPAEWNRRIIDYVGALANIGKPLVVIDNEAEFPVAPRQWQQVPIALFRDNSRAAGELVARRLLALGHRRIAYIAPWHRFDWSVERLRGIKEVYTASGLGKEVIELTAPLDNAAIPRGFRLALADPKITAWVCSSDSVGLEALKYLKSHDIGVPGRISVASFDNTLLSFEHKLTSVDLNLDTVGYRVLRFMSGRLRPHSHDALVVEKITPTLMERASIGKV